MTFPIEEYCDSTLVVVAILYTDDDGDAVENIVEADSETSDTAPGEQSPNIPSIGCCCCLYVLDVRVVVQAQEEGTMHSISPSYFSPPSPTNMSTVFSGARNHLSS